MPSPLPVRDGVGATRLRVPATGVWPTVSAYMVERFGHLEPDRLLARFDRGEIVDITGQAVSVDAPLGSVDFVWYYREPPVEREIPFTAPILHQDADLVVIDKPHFLPTTPGGKFLQNSALVRLRRELDNPDITPIHRLDRATAGLVMFSARPETRGAYQLLFQNRAITKIYQAVSQRPAGWDASALPMTVRCHIEKFRGEVCVQVSDENPNSETLVDLIAADAGVIHTRLAPHSGKMHQLRVHLAKIGIPILNDNLYPVLLPETADDWDAPLQLLAEELRFSDPLSGAERVFRSERSLSAAP